MPAGEEAEIVAGRIGGGAGREATAAEESGRLKRGMKIACVAFGSGFTWGAAILDW